MNATGPYDEKSTLVQVMAWCRQATSHYVSQCWLRSLSPYGVVRPQWVKWVQLICVSKRGLSKKRVDLHEECELADFCIFMHFAVCELLYPGPCFNTETVFLALGIPIIKITLLSCLYNENPFTGKKASLYWDNPLVVMVFNHMVFW